MPSRGTWLDRPERWACANAIKFNKAKRNVLHLGWDNPKQKHRLGGEQIESSPEKDLGVVVDEKLNMTWCGGLSAQKVYCIPGYIKSSMASRAREVILPPVPHLQYSIQLWGPQHKKDMELLRQLQRTATKMITGLEHFCEDRLRQLGLFSLEKRRGTF